jgi:2-oxoglutarate dehydrogenase E1 component
VLPLLGDETHRERVRRLVLCSGKVGIDLLALANQLGQPTEWLSATRLEQLYPFPLESLDAAIGSFPRLEEVVWLQEEPANMGGWSFMRPRLESLLSRGVGLRYIGRPERASTAEGSPEAHAREQRRILEAALVDGEDIQIETRGVQHASRD